jgi:thioredoxin reductase
MQLADYDVVVVGGGASGLAAAVEAGGLGLKTALVDERKTLGGSHGGELGRTYNDDDPWQLPPIFNSEQTCASVEELCKEVETVPVDILLDRFVWSIFPEGSEYRLALTDGKSAASLVSKAVVAATGLYVAPHPFPGSNLSGAMVPSQAYQMGLTAGFRAGERALVYGQNAVGAALREWAEGHGLKVVAWLRDPLDCEPANDETMAVNGTLEMEGQEKVEAVKFKVGSEVRREEVDHVFMAAPLAYSYELVSVAGAEVVWTGFGRGFAPRFDQRLMTSLPGVAVAGSVAGAQSVPDRIAQGRAAALAVVDNLGYAPEDFEQSSPFAVEQLVEECCDVTPAGTFYEELGDMEVTHLICPCLDHLLGEVITSINLGCRTLDDVKRISGAGMGHCQGRNCYRALVQLLKHYAGVMPSTLDTLRIRPPIRPFSAKALYEGKGEVAND